MNREELFLQIKKKRSFLCVGLDSEITKIPSFLIDFPDPVFEFNRQIIDATHEYSVAYKPNLAFYECLGSSGWLSLEKTIRYLKVNYPDLFIIADAKRGDIGNTSGLYARAIFDSLDADAVTVAPYMGSDSVKPFLSRAGKWIILLALTSNPGANDFQFLKDEITGDRLFEQVLKKSQQWGTPENMMYVAGATRADNLEEIRRIVPDHFLLIPGVGAQGGSLEEVARHGLNDRCGLLVNSSRGIIYASPDEDFAERAGQEARILKDQMEKLLSIKGIF